MRTERLVISSDDINKTENEWWDEHSSIIETVWAHTYSLQKCIRYPYLRNAKKFLQSRGGKKLIWEVGCGTGWVCRMIADENFNIIGTDFSKAQIDMAKAQAILFNKQKYCSYQVSDASSVVEEHDGIFIHAILHHLSEEELKGFFELIGKQKKDTRFFLYEPIFPQAASDKVNLQAFLFKKLIDVYKKSAKVLIRIFGKRNNELITRTELISRQAEKNGWFMSPKEVPFYEKELDTYLERHFNINKKYFVNMTDYSLAMSLVMYDLGEPGFLFKRIILPLATWLDKVFFSLDFRSVIKGQYLFCCYELVKK